MADLAKIKIGSTVYNLKDADSRSKLTTMLGDHAVAALGAAAWLGQDASLTDSGTGVVAGGVIKAYVDAQVATIHSFDVVIDSAGTSAGPSVAASASTMYKIYMVPDADVSAGTYVEWITIRSGAEGSYTYAWEKIGSTKTDLTGYVPKERKVAGVDLQDDITVAEMQSALGLGDLAYKDSASGNFTPEGTISEVDATPAGSVTVTLKDAASASEATLTKAAYTPAGSISVDGSAQASGNKVLKGGSISVSVKDAATASEASLTKGDYTPAGSVAITADDSGSFQVAGTNASSAVSFTGGSTKNVLASVKTAAVAPSFTEGAFTAASLGEGFYTAGSAASYSHSGFSGGSLGAASKSSFNTDAMKMHIAAGTEISGDVDAETLIIEAASTSEAVTAQGEFTAAVYGTDSFTANTPAVIDVTKFSGGSKAADTWNAGSAAEFNTADVVDNIGSGTAAAQVFTGSKYAPSFTGTKEENLKVSKVEYLKQEIDSATFTGTEAALAFAGTKVDDALVSKVEYLKSAVDSASFSGTTNKITPTFSGTQGEVSVS